jgi:hypothetical protein
MSKRYSAARIVESGHFRSYLMNNDGFTKLFSTIITSSIWSENDKTRILWITMLALTDKNGICSATIPGLAATARMTLEEVEASILILEKPDPYSRSTAAEGRRIQKVDGGWFLTNYGEYRKKRQQEERREYMRRYIADRRSVNNNVNNGKQKLTMLAHAEAEAEAEAKREIPVPDAKAHPKQAARPRVLTLATDEQWLAEIRPQYAKIGVDVDVETVKATVWLTTPKGKGRKFTRHFFINWLNKADRTIQTTDIPSNGRKARPFKDFVP